MSVVGCQLWMLRFGSPLKFGSHIRFLFAILVGMEIGGYNKVPDWVKLGPAMLIASCLILAIRTAKWPARRSGATESDRELEVEVDHAIYAAGKVLAVLVSRKANLFPSKDVPWYVADDTDEPK